MHPAYPKTSREERESMHIRARVTKRAREKDGELQNPKGYGYPNIA